MASYLFPRNKKIWIIGSLNKFSCNSKYFYIYFNENKKKYPDIELVWLSKDKNTIKKMHEKGLNTAVYAWSVKGIYYLLRSGVYITSYPVEESLCIWTMGNAKYINLWHGVGLKYHRFMQKDKKSYYYFHNKITKILLYPILINFYKKINLFISTSPEMDTLFKKSFRLEKESIYNAIYPRCEFITKNKEYIDYIINKYDIDTSITIIHKIESYTHTYLYMPTWRDDNSNFIDNTGINFEHLNTYLKRKNSLFIIKAHPRTSISDKLVSDYSNILILDNNVDIYSILPYVNTLITDYSSIYYDALLLPDMNKILFPFDIEIYKKNSRDLAFSFEDCTAHPKAYTYEQLLYIMTNYSHIRISSDDNSRVKNMFWSTHNNTADIITRIKKL